MVSLNFSSSAELVIGGRTVEYYVWVRSRLQKALT